MLFYLHYFCRLCADAGDALNGQRSAAGFFRDLAILLDDEAARRLVFCQAADDFSRHSPVRALRAILIDDVEEHEFALRIGSRFLRHGALVARRPIRYASESKTENAGALSRRRGRQNSIGSRARYIGSPSTPPRF